VRPVVLNVGTKTDKKLSKKFFFLEIILNTLLSDQHKTIKAGKFMKITLSKQQKTIKKIGKLLFKQQKIIN
jgi:hypothetical protein